MLYIQGPSTSSAAAQRTIGMESTKPENIKLKTLRCGWLEEGAREAVTAWLRLSTSRAATIDVIGCQSDSIAVGAKKALEDHTDSAERELWMQKPLTGIDGLPTEGKAWVDQRTLTATIVAGTTTEIALHLVARALSGEAPPERTVIEAKSYPSLEKLNEMGAKLQRQSPHR